MRMRGEIDILNARDADYPADREGITPVYRLARTKPAGASTTRPATTEAHHAPH